jgi:hypothetical protein
MRRVAMFAAISVIVVGCAKDQPVAAGPTAPATGHARATRVAVKHATDPDAASIDLTPKKTTLAELEKVRRPGDLKDDLSNSEYQNKRLDEFEKSTWEVDANVRSIVQRKDGDYYMVLEDGQGHETVVEVPDPEQCKGSPLEAQISATRKDLEQRFHPTTETKEINQPATVRGVGFHGFKGKSGGSSNGSRLMPGTGFEWQKKKQP